MHEKSPKKGLLYHIAGYVKKLVIDIIFNQRYCYNKKSKPFLRNPHKFFSLHKKH